MTREERAELENFKRENAEMLKRLIRDNIPEELLIKLVLSMLETAYCCGKVQALQNL